MQHVDIVLISKGLFRSENKIKKLEKGHVYKVTTRYSTWIIVFHSIVHDSIISYVNYNIHNNSIYLSPDKLNNLCMIKEIDSIDSAGIFGVKLLENAIINFYDQRVRYFRENTKYILTDKIEKIRSIINDYISKLPNDE